MVDLADRDRNWNLCWKAGLQRWSSLPVMREAGIAALIALAVFSYAPYFSDYMIPKKAAIHAMVALLLGIWLSRAAVRGSLRLERSSVYLPLMVYLGVSLLSLAVAHNRRYGAETLLMQGWLLVFALLVFHHVRDWSAMVRVLWIVVLVSVPVSCLGLLQYAGIHLIPLPGVYGNLPVSTLGNLNFVAHYLEVIVVLLAGLLMATRRWGERLVLIGALIAAVSHLLLTRTRGGWLAAVLGLLVLLLLHKGRLGKWGKWRFKMILAILSIALLSPVASLIRQPFQAGWRGRFYEPMEQVAKDTADRALSLFESSDFTVSQRRIVWLDTVDMMGENFWLGVGPGNYALFLPAYRSMSRHRQWRQLMGERREVAYRAHNEYLQVFAEKGLIGFTAFIWLLGTVLWTGYVGLRHLIDERARVMGCACLAAMSATLVHSFFSFNLQDPTSAVHFWLLGGLSIAIDKLGAGTAEGRCSSSWEWSLPKVFKPFLLLVAALVVFVGGYVGSRLLMADYHYFRGLQYNRIDQPNRAMLAFGEAIEWRDYDFRYYHMLGLALVRTERYAEAVQALTRSLELHSHNAPAMRLLGRALYQRQRNVEAAAVLRRALALAPLEGEVYALLALAYRQQGAHDRAIEIWQQALLLEPQNTALLNSLAVELSQAGEPEKAVELLRQAVHSHPRDRQLQDSLIGFYLAGGEHAQAESLLVQTVEQYPEQVDLRLRLAQLYMHQERLPWAWAEVERVLEREPENPLAQQLARMLRQLLQEEEP